MGTDGQCSPAARVSTQTCESTEQVEAFTGEIKRPNLTSYSYSVLVLDGQHTLVKSIGIVPVEFFNIGSADPLFLLNLNSLYIRCRTH